MPHISSKQLDSKHLLELSTQLIKMFGTVGVSRKNKILFDEFFTDTEKIMFAKRLAIIFMLEDGISKPYISDMLFVSPSTVDRVSLKHEVGLYSYISNIIKKNNRTIFETIENMIHDNVSKRLGKRRLAWMDDLEHKYNKKIFKY